MSAFDPQAISSRDLNRLPYLHWGWFLVFGLIIACISATLLHLNLRMQARPSVWHTTFLIKLAVWWFWSAVSYGVFLLSKKIRFNRSQWLAGFLFHLMFSLITVGLNILFYALLIKFLVLPGAEFGFSGVYVNVFLNQFEWFFIMYWAIILVGYAFDYYQRFRKEEVRSLQFESRMVEAQLQALKMQLHPHFLFNTLNTISAMIRQAETDKANDMLIRLSDFLRRTLMMKEEQQISLEEELTFIRQYLDIEQIRFQKDLDIIYDISEESRLAMVPNLLLQPLVENAIYHGISQKRGASRIRIQCRIVADSLHLDVYNDGHLLPDDFDLREQEGIGLQNTLNRLDQLFEGDAHFSLTNQPEGVLAHVQIPYQSAVA